MGEPATKKNINSSDPAVSLSPSKKLEKSTASGSRGVKDPTDANEKGAKASFAKGLFFGNVLSDLVYPYPEQNPNDDLLKMTVQSIEKLQKDIDVHAIEEHKKIPDDLMKKFKELGLFGLIIPEAYGGFGFSTAQYIQVLSCLSMIDSSITVTIGAHQSIGLKALLMFGTEEQKKKYLPKLASGEMIAAFGLTEPGAGSDAGGIKTKATLSEDGKFYILNGSKIWITNGGMADFFTVFAKTPVYDEETKTTKEKVTAFIVTRDLKGFSSGAEEKKMGLLGSSTVPLTFDSVPVPIENILGEVGKGFKVAMAVLNNGRLGLAGACAISARRPIHMALSHALMRKQFNEPIAKFGQIQSKFANMLIGSYAAESMVVTTARLMDEGKYDYSLESALCKIFATENFWFVVNECLQIAGGTGYMKEYGYEKILRDSRIFMIWEGTNEILRTFVGLSGVQGPSQELTELSKTLKEPLHDVIKSLGMIGDYGKKWLKRHLAPNPELNWVAPVFEKDAAGFEKLTIELANTTETLLIKLGKKIVTNQFVIKRLSAIAVDLYGMICVLSRGTLEVEKKGREAADMDVMLVKGFCKKARKRIRDNLLRLKKPQEDKLEEDIAQAFYKVGILTDPFFR